MPPLVRPTNANEARALADWAASVPAVPEPIARAVLLKKLSYMHSVLPSRNVDLEKGKEKATVYVTALQHFSEGAITEMARRAVAELEWFPSVKWCVEAAGKHQGEGALARTARALARQYWAEQYRAWRRALLDGAADQRAIDAAPERWRRSAEAEGLLNKDEGSGTYCLRLRRVETVLAENEGER